MVDAGDYNIAPQKAALRDVFLKRKSMGAGARDWAAISAVLHTALDQLLPDASLRDATAAALGALAELSRSIAQSREHVPEVISRVEAGAARDQAAIAAVAADPSFGM